MPPQYSGRLLAVAPTHISHSPELVVHEGRYFDLVAGRAPILKILFVL